MISISATQLGVGFLLYVVGRIIYLRYFHPLAHIPGPFFASITGLHRFYYDYIRNGSYYLQFERYRDIYGPAIRIAPHEVLLTDPAHHETIFSNTTKFYKDPRYYRLTGADTSIFAMVSNEAHRRYRAILNPFFSRRSVLAQEAVVQTKTDRLLQRIEADSARGEATFIGTGFRAISIDVITEYAFGPGRCWDFLERKDFGGWFSELGRAIAPMVYVLQIFPILRKPMQEMPPWLARKLSPIVVGLLDIMDLVKKDVEHVVGDIHAGVHPEKPTIFHTVLNPDAKAALLGGNTKIVPTVKHMVDEAFVVVGAASETVGNTMTVCTFHVLSNRDIYAKLRAELVAAFPDPTQKVDTLTLEKLPYLTGVIKEGLRLSYGVLHPLPRVVPEPGASFNGYWFKAGTVVSMTAWLMHRDKTMFPDPDKFDPERWLDPQEAQARERYLVPFSKGNRICIGQPLSMCELYVAVGRLFRSFDDLEAIDVGPEDMVYEDYFGGFHPKNARPFRIMRTGKRVC